MLTDNSTQKMKGISIVVIIMVLAMRPAWVEASKILLISPPTYSHCREMSSVGQQLLENGHNVTILIPLVFKHRNCHIRGSRVMNVIWVQPDHSIESTANLTRALSRAAVGGETLSFIGRLRLTRRMIDGVCGNFLSDTETISALKDEGFDLVILNGAFVVYCLYVIPHFLRTPHVTLGSYFEDVVTGRPFLPSISPDVSSGKTDLTSFGQRLTNAVSQIMFHWTAKSFIPIERVRVFAPELSKQDVINLVSKSQLFLYNYDIILAYPLPLMPNHVFIGGVALEPSQPLQGDLANFYDGSFHGVVLVTFGGNTMDLPDFKVDILMRVFQRLKLDVLWKYETESKVGNVKQVKWVPQLDVLANPKTQLFVSHCGNNGIFEALYHGVPIVCVPLFTDQFYNGARLKDWGVALSLPMAIATENSLFDAITEVLYDPKYKHNMARASEMYKSRPDSPRQRAASAVEHVLKFGGEHLRSNALDMSMFVYMGYDIVCFVFTVFIVSVLSIIQFFRVLWRRYTKKLNKKKLA